LFVVQDINFHNVGILERAATMILLDAQKQPNRDCFDCEPLKTISMLSGPWQIEMFGGVRQLPHKER
jgi:hypothetical protein